MPENESDILHTEKRRTRILSVIAVVATVVAVWCWQEKRTQESETSLFGSYVAVRSSQVNVHLAQHEDGIQDFQTYVSQVTGPDGRVHITARESELSEQYLHKLAEVVSSVRDEMDRTLTFEQFRDALRKHNDSPEVRIGAKCTLEPSATQLAAVRARTIAVSRSG
jgi:hypothetical protein